MEIDENLIPKDRAPHCDELALHAPLSCKYCDLHPELQQYRIDNNINFTGENNPNKKPCPAEQRRKLDTINRWPGNRPLAPGGCPECDHPGNWINLALICPTHGKFAG